MVITIALDGDEDDQIHCFKPEENTFVAIFGDIAEATPTEMLIDKDEEGDKELMYYYGCIYYLRFSYQKNAAKSDSI